MSLRSGCLVFRRVTTEDVEYAGTVYLLCSCRTRHHTPLGTSHAFKNLQVPRGHLEDTGVAATSCVLSKAFTKDRKPETPIVAGSYSCMVARHDEAPRITSMTNRQAAWTAKHSGVIFHDLEYQERKNVVIASSISKAQTVATDWSVRTSTQVFLILTSAPQPSLPQPLHPLILTPAAVPTPTANITTTKFVANTVPNPVPSQ